MVVERREAQRARSRRFAQADCSVARATPEARAGGNIRPRGVAHDPGASRRSILFQNGNRERAAPRPLMSRGGGALAETTISCVTLV